ncbi:MAG: branched-chain amino acid ABC transporter permease [Phototrophicales bacterium]|nr:branched-chain amino acid ABC transporter permease [Phototrophicales bacterium]
MAANTLPQGRKINLPKINWQAVSRWATFVGVIVFILWLGDRIGDNPRNYAVVTINGILVGGIYAIIAVGIVMINKASGVFNFAHGAMMLLTAWFFLSFYNTDNFNLIVVIGFVAVTVGLFITMSDWRDIRNPRSLITGAVAGAIVVFLMMLSGDDFRLIRALVGAMTMATLMGLCIERFAIRPLMGQPVFTMILMTLALDRIFVGLTNFFFPSIDSAIPLFNNLSNLGIPRNYEIDVINVIPEIDRALRIPSASVIVFLLAVLAFVAFILFFQYTNVGLSMRATAENQVLAQSVGLRVRSILAIAWVAAALLALTAGVLFGGRNSLGPSMPTLALIVFPAVLLGGIESIGGAFVGGIVIGLGQTWGDQLFQSEAGTQLVPYVILMIVLIFKPDGLFGQKRIERI